MALVRRESPLAVGLCLVGGVLVVAGPAYGLLHAFDSIASSPSPDPAMLRSNIKSSLLWALPGLIVFVAGLLWLALASRTPAPRRSQ